MAKFRCLLSKCNQILKNSRSNNLLSCPRCLTNYKVKTLPKNQNSISYSKFPDIGLLQLDQPRLIFFDMDGTLVEAFPNFLEIIKRFLVDQGFENHDFSIQTWRQAFEHAEKVFILEWNKLEEYHLLKSIVFRKNSWLAFYTAILEGLKIEKSLVNRFTPKLYERFRKIQRIPVFDQNIVENIQYLRTKDWIPILLTNRLQDPTPVLPAELINKFEAILYAGMFQSRKPSAEFFQRALNWVHQQLDISNTSTINPIYVGDSWYFDVNGARNAGWTPIFIDRYELFYSQKENTANTVILSSVEQLKQRWNLYYE